MSRMLSNVTVSGMQVLVSLDCDSHLLGDVTGCNAMQSHSDLYEQHFMVA